MTFACGPPIRHPANVAFDAWLKTDLGQRCAAGEAKGEYMKNRLYHAFMDGYAAAESVRTSKGVDHGT